MTTTSVKITRSKARIVSIGVTIKVQAEFEQGEPESLRYACELIGETIASVLPEEARTTFVAQLEEARKQALANPN